MDKDEWTTSFVKGVGGDGLAPGATTPAIVVRAQQGYTGTEPRLTMLQNAYSWISRSRSSASTGPPRWVKLGEYPIKRQLLTR